LRLVGTMISYNKRSYDTAWRNRGYWQINGEEEIKNESSSWSGCFKRGKSGFI
jgi:hypothetical protein